MEYITGEQINELEKFYRINLINSLAGFKSLNLLGTISEDQATNLCIISSAFHLGANPPLIGLVMRPERAHNDTLRNIRTTGEYTLNNVQPEWYKQAHQTSASYASGISEFDACGFDEYHVDGFSAPFVKQSSIRIGLRLKQMIDIELNGTTIVIGEIVRVLIDDALLSQDGTIDHVQAKTMTVAGLDTYFIPQLAGRLSYAKPGTEPTEILPVTPSSKI